MYTRIFRFAPSPNGYLHLGHAYSALLNDDMAREAGGRLLLRIEDIDPRAAGRNMRRRSTRIFAGSASLGRSPRGGRANISPIIRRLSPSSKRRADLSELREPQRDQCAGRRTRAPGQLAARSGRRTTLSRRRAQDAARRTRTPPTRRRAVCAALAMDARSRASGRSPGRRPAAARKAKPAASPPRRKCGAM